MGKVVSLHIPSSTLTTGYSYIDDKKGWASKWRRNIQIEKLLSCFFYIFATIYIWHGHKSFSINFIQVEYHILCKYGNVLVTLFNFLPIFFFNTYYHFLSLCCKILLYWFSSSWFYFKLNEGIKVLIIFIHE